MNRWVRREVTDQLRENPVARSGRYGLGHHALRRFFSWLGTFGRFIIAYMVVNVVIVAAEVLCAWLVPAWLPTWSTSGLAPATDIKTLMLNVSSYLLGAQIGVLGVISLSLALVTLIAQREGASTDVKVYYHESFTFELVASCVALAAVLCAQFLWPLQFLIHRLGLGTELQFFKLCLLGLHLAWLLVNLAAVAYFIATTFRFVQQSAREALRERYTANVVLPRDLTQRLREQLYGLAGHELIGDDEGDRRNPTATFGFDVGGLWTVELETHFARPVALHDVRMIWVRWVLRRWSARCVKAAAQQPALTSHGLGSTGPSIRFTPRIGATLSGNVSWCRRRGGEQLTKFEKFVLRRAFVFRTATMKNDLPRPEEILEELAEKVASQIERLAPVAFDGAFREMTQYHRFLLALGASRDPDGATVNFAEIAGNALHAPHKKWISQYGRLFERAADKLVDDSYFVRTLANVPSQLIPRPGDPELSPNVVRAILDLGPLLVGRLEAWVTKRTTVETRQGQAAEPRLTLAGSDAKAYESVVPNIVGAWESLLHYPPLMYSWREGGAQTDVERWAAFRASWPFLWQHLTNTAYCLATAVWNEDETGAALFREALVRWVHALDHRLNDRAELRHRRLLFPSILDLNWPEASAKAAQLSYDYMPPPTPDQLFASIVRGAHDDIVLLTAALMLFWTINEKQASDIGARTAQALLSREASEDDHRNAGRQPLSFCSLFLDLLRLEMTGDRYRRGSYAANLDHAVGMFDNMTERRVVPGRVYTPSTLHDRDGLLLSDLVLLLAHVPNQGNDGLKDRIIALAHEEEVLPEGDGSLRNILHQLGRFQSALGQQFPAIDSGIRLLSPDRDLAGSKARLQEIINTVSDAIEEHRRHRLQARPVDPAKLERLRSAIEETLLSSEVEAPFFRGVKVGRAAESDSALWRDISFEGISKAQLTEPPMELPISNLEESVVSRSRMVAGFHAWQSFCQRSRIEATVAGRVDDEAFWLDLRPLVQQVGPEPVLIVSGNAEGQALRRFLYAPAADRPGLAIERRRREGGQAPYIATVEGVDVFGAAFLSPGEAWLFSATALREVRYAETKHPDRHAELTFELGENLTGTLNVRMRQACLWSNTPTFQLKAPDPAAESEMEHPT